LFFRMKFRAKFISTAPGKRAVQEWDPGSKGSQKVHVIAWILRAWWTFPHKWKVMAYLNAHRGDPEQ
jgi:hypothetical protein